MKFIAQFNSSISGTSSTLLSDVFLYDEKIIVFDKSSNGNFELRIIENNAYLMHTKEFDNFIINKDVHSNDCNLLHLWRAKKVSSPELMPMRYYEDIMHTHNLQELIAKNNLREIKEEFNKLNKYLDENTY